MYVVFVSCISYDLRVRVRFLLLCVFVVSMCSFVCFVFLFVCVCGGWFVCVPAVCCVVLILFVVVVLFLFL